VTHGVTSFLSIAEHQQGVTPPAVGWTAIDSVLLGSLHNYRLLLREHNILTEPSPNDPTQPRLSILGHALAGLGAGITRYTIRSLVRNCSRPLSNRLSSFSSVVATPMETLKVKLQIQYEVNKADRQFSGPIDCLRKIIRKQGILGLYNGFLGTVASRSNFMIFFGSFEGSK